MSGVPFPMGPYPPQIPGRVYRKVQRYPMPDGTLRERRWTQITHQAPDGSWQTEELTEVVPPLDDGIVPADMTDVVYCRICQTLKCRSAHGFVCEACGLTYCVACRVRVKTEDREVQLCKPCAQEAVTPAFIRKFRKIVWGK